MWYALQTVIIVAVMYVYMTQIHDNPNNTVGYDFALAVIVAYCVTWVLSKLFDTVKFLGKSLRHIYRYASGHRSRLGGSQDAGSQRRINSSGWRD